MAVAPALTVDAQPRVALPYGLFSVITPRQSPDVHWQNGVQWEALTCEAAGGIGDVTCDPDTDPVTGMPKVFADGSNPGEASAFVIYGSYACSPAGNTIQHAQDQAMAHLLAREEARVEQALWTGDLDNTGFAAGAESVGTALDPAYAVGLLEDWLAENYGSLGVLHMQRSLATVLLAKDVLIVKGNGVFTVLGTPVVAGGGYPGTDTNGDAPAADTAYIYATPALLGYRSDPFAGADPVSAGFNAATNDLHAVAERTYVVGYDPCGTAVAQVSLA